MEDGEGYDITLLLGPFIIFVLKKIKGTDPIAYMTTDLSPEGLMAVYEALEWTPEGKVAVKLSTGEPPASCSIRSGEFLRNQTK